MNIINPYRVELRPLDGNEDINIATSQGENCTSQYTTVGFPTTLILVPLTSDVQWKLMIRSKISVFHCSNFLAHFNFLHIHKPCPYWRCYT